MELFLYLTGFLIAGLLGRIIWVVLTRKDNHVESSEPVKTITKAERNELGKSDWVASFEGDPTEGRHFIKKTNYTKLEMKDGSEWTMTAVAEHAPTWWCSCGANGREFVWNSDFKKAEREALEKATTHVNDNNYAERKMNSGLDRAF